MFFLYPQHAQASNTTPSTTQDDEDGLGTLPGNYFSFLQNPGYFLTLYF